MSKLSKNDKILIVVTTIGISIIFYFIIAHDNNLPPFHEPSSREITYIPGLQVNATKSWSQHVQECNGIVFTKNGSKDLCLTNTQIYDLAKKLGATEMPDDYQTSVTK